MKHLLSRLLRIAFACVTGAWAQEFYVSPVGNDSGTGTQVSPFATVERARSAARTAARGSAPAVIWLGGGDYLRTNEFLLSTTDTNCLYRAVPGETPRFVGGPRLDLAWFTLVTSNSPVWNRLATAAQGNLWQMNLGAHGLTNYGTLQRRGFGSSPNGPMELFINGRPQELGRWPNAGAWATIATAVSTNQFTYSGTQPSRWTQAEEIWFHGYFGNWWADFAITSAGINTTNKTVTLASPAPSYGIVAGQAYFAFNLLEEIDTPGEYYLNRSTGILYVWPPASLTNAEIMVSVIEQPLVHVTGSRDVTWDGIALLGARGNLVRVDSGTNVTFNHCRLLGSGSDAATINGTSNGLDRCEIADAGGKGVVLNGGSRTTLVAGGNYARQSRIHDFSRLTLTYTPGVSVNGVGQIAEHCEIHGSSHSGIIFGGNEHHMEYNHIHDVCKWSSDAGAIYCGRDWGLRGNQLRFNFIHDVNTGFGGLGVHAIYLDDCASGLTVFGNVFYRIETEAMKNGGGRDNDWENNVAAKCGIYHASDTRGLTRITTNGDSWDLLAKIRANSYQQPPWSNAYPALAAIPNDYNLIGPYKTPGGTIFSRNVSWQNTTDYSQSGSAFNYYAQMTSNLTGQNPLFVDETNLDLTLQTNSPAFSLPGFQPIPFRDIGITPLTWDANPALPNAQNGSGVWSDGGGNWWDGSQETWNNNLPADAIIGVTNGGTGYTVTLGSDIIAGNLILSQSGCTNVGTLDLGTASATVSNLWVQADITNPNTLLIGTGQSFTVLGDFIIGVNSRTNAVTKLTATGAGALNVIHSGGIVQIGAATGSVNANAATLDLSGLTNFTANLGSTGAFRVGDTATTSSGSRGASTAILAVNTTLTAGTLGIGDNTGAGTTETLKLGSGITAINANTINIGLTNSASRSSGQVLFNTTNGSLTIRGAAGGSSRAALNIGNHTSATGATITGLLDLAGHSADLMLSALTIASRRALSAANDTGTLTFDSGSLNTSTVLLGQRQSATSGTSAGFLTIGGGTATIGSITMADSLTAGATANGTLTLTGGTVTVSGNITKGSSTGKGTATVTLDGATLDMAGFAIGGTSPVTFNAMSGTLRNISQLNNGAALLKSTAGTLTLAGTNTYTGATIVSDGTLLVTGLIPNSAVTVAGGATLGGSGGISGTATVQTGGSIQAGDLTGSGTLKVGTLNLGTAAGAVTSSRFTIAGGGKIAATTLNVTGSHTINILDGSLAVGTNTLITYTGSIGGSGFAGFRLGMLGTLPAGTTAFLKNTGSAVQLVVTPLVAPVLASTPAYGAGGFSLSFSNSNSGQSYRVLATTNLSLPMTNWLALTNGTFGAGAVNFTDPVATNRQKFYRIASP